MVKQRRTARRRKQRGGNIPTFVGKSLNYSNLNTYPGVANHGGNYYAYNKLPIDLQTGNNFFKGNLTKGGYTYRKNSSMRKSRRRRFRGGDFPLWSDVRTSLQLAQNNIANTHNTLIGKEHLVSPLAWRDQYI
jgi:hypothetical protein